MLKKEMRYHYYIAYMYENGLASCGIDRNYPITSNEEIVELAEEISKSQMNGKQIVIVNYIFLRKEKK